MSEALISSLTLSIFVFCVRDLDTVCENMWENQASMKAASFLLLVFMAGLAKAQEDIFSCKISLSLSLYLSPTLPFPFSSVILFFSSSRGQLIIRVLWCSFLLFVLHPLFSLSLFPSLPSHRPSLSLSLSLSLRLLVPLFFVNSLAPRCPSLILLIVEYRY